MNAPNQRQIAYAASVAAARRAPINTRTIIRQRMRLILEARFGDILATFPRSGRYITQELIRKIDNALYNRADNMQWYANPATLDRKVVLIAKVMIKRALKARSEVVQRTLDLIHEYECEMAEIEELEREERRLRRQRNANRRNRRRNR